MAPLSYTSVPTPIGTMYVAATVRGICRVTYDDTDEEFEEDLQARYGRAAAFAPKNTLLQDAELQLERYFLGELRAFDVALDFLEGTPFMHRAWRVQTSIPYGQVRSYKWVAEQVGKPRAARAAGQANSRCCVSIFVPCHRVISHDGSIGGYGDRLEVKKFLLRMEGAVWGRGMLHHSVDDAREY